jgi:hypothetical protein
MFYTRLELLIEYHGETPPILVTGTISIMVMAGNLAPLTVTADVKVLPGIAPPSLPSVQTSTRQTTGRHTKENSQPHSRQCRLTPYSHQQLLTS